MANFTDKIHLQWFGDEEITLDTIRAFIESNKDRADVAEYVTSLGTEKPLTSENVQAYLGTIEGKNLLQPIVDRANTQAIKSHDEKQKPIIEAMVKAKVNEELQRLNPQETPEQRQIREMRQEQDAMKAQWEKERLDNLISMEAAKRNVPIELVKDVPFPSLDHAVNLFTVWDQIKAKEIEKELNVRLANTPKPSSGKSTDNGPDFKNMSHEEKEKYFREQAEMRESKVS